LKTVNIKDTVHERLKEEAERTDLSISTIITIAFNEYMRNKYKQDIEKPKPKEDDVSLTENNI